MSAAGTSFVSPFQTQLLLIHPGVLDVVFSPEESLFCLGYQYKYKYCYSSSVVDFFQQTSAMTTNFEQLLTESLPQ